MIPKKAYGPTTVAAGAALLMVLSIVINESLVERAFGTYTLRAFGGDPDGRPRPGSRGRSSPTHCDLGELISGQIQKERRMRTVSISDMGAIRPIRTSPSLPLHA